MPRLLPSRASDSLWAQWFWTIDRVSVALTLTLLFLGIALVTTTSPAVAQHYGVDAFFFTKRHVVFIAPTLFVCFMISLLPNAQLRRGALYLFALSWIGLWLTFVCGIRVKGARRWCGVRGLLVLQPSEFIKPALTLLTAWFLTEQKRLKDQFPGHQLAWAFLIAALLPIVLQPDFGMSASIAGTFFAQIFLAGLSWIAVGAFLALGVLGLGAAYWTLPHVQHRIQVFFNPHMGNPFDDQYQVMQALSAVKSGGLWGRGPAEGLVKHTLPDCHTDFVFSVAAEEFGSLSCLIILALYIALLARFIWRTRHTSDLWTRYAVFGLCIQMALQILINTASNVALIPPKGMSLPLLSYGGSSLLSTGITLGCLLALTRKAQHSHTPVPHTV